MKKAKEFDESINKWMNGRWNYPSKNETYEKNLKFRVLQVSYNAIVYANKHQN